MNNKTRYMTLSAVLAALVFIVTRFIQIPIPLGYFNVGNSIILIACTILPFPYGIYVGAIGSALADLTSYPVYTIPTLIIKTLMPLVFYLLTAKGTRKDTRQLIIASLVSTLIPLFGYTLTGGILYGGIIAGLAQFPGLFLEYVANFIIFILLDSVILKYYNKFK